MERLGLEEDQPIEHGLLSRAVENAQRKVEARNYDIRKQLLEYDNVMNMQREVIYDQRREVLVKADHKETVWAWLSWCWQTTWTPTVVKRAPGRMGSESVADGSGANFLSSAHDNATGPGSREQRRTGAVSEGESAYPLRRAGGPN